MDSSELPRNLERELPSGSQISWDNRLADIAAEALLSKMNFKGADKCIEHLLGKYSAADLKEKAHSACTIILKNGDFSYSLKREKLGEIFKDAINRGPEAQTALCAAMNKELAGHNSTLRVQGHYGKEHELESVKPNVSPHLAIEIIPEVFKNEFASGEYFLRDINTGVREDSLKVRGRLLSRQRVQEHMPFPRLEFL